MIAVQPTIHATLRTIAPFWESIRTYRVEYAKKDIIAALTVATVLIPQAMAYSLLAGLPPMYGLYAALVGSAVGSLWGSSPYLATGPVAIVSFLSAATVASFAPQGSPEFVAITITLALLVGIIQLCLGVFRFGFIMRFVPHPVLKGFSTAAAIIIACTQIPNLLGFSSQSHEFVYQTLASLVMSSINAHPLTMIIGIISLGVILTLKRFVPKLPSALIVISTTILLSYLLDLKILGVGVVGTISSSLPTAKIPTVDVHTIASLITKSAIIALVGFLEAYAVAKTFSKSEEKVDVNQELIGQGLANTASGVFGGFTVSGSFSRTAVNHSAGAKTLLVGVYVSLLIVVVLLFLTPLLAYLPKTVLAAVVIAAVLQLIDFKSLSHMFTLSK